MTGKEIKEALSLVRPDEIEDLFARAYAEKIRSCGIGVAVRGIVEAGNICAKDCFYCGIRKSNGCVGRYSLPLEEIVAGAETCRRLGYASLVIQSGEIESETHTRFIEDALRAIAPLKLGVTLSLGEQTEEVYARWRAAGATRYLLRIETSNRKLYAKIHPPECSWERRVECLRALRRCDYQVGTGVMCALPGQTVDDLARDIEFYREIDADMIGMGPYLEAENTPLREVSRAECIVHGTEERLLMGLKMIAATRLHLKDVNIAAATALQALADDGRERGVKAGANVIMPNVTDVRYRRNYQLYSGKPCLDENASMCRSGLDRRLAAIGERILYGEYGDSRRYSAKHVS